MLKNLDSSNRNTRMLDPMSSSALRNNNNNNTLQIDESFDRQ